MMRSMSSAVSALRNHQTRMDVVGNNIANVNTVGYKTSRVVFRDSLSQAMRGASGPTEARGGMNPQQIGMGMNIASIDTIFTQGVADNTNNLRDVMIEGEGFFMVSADGNTEGKFYTRAGNFNVDSFGNLVNADGLRVLGYQADKDGSLGTALGSIVIPLADTFPPKVTGKMEIQGNLDARTKTKSWTAAIGTEASNVLYLEKTVGDPPKKFYSLNKKFADEVARETDTYVYDSLGGKHRVKLAFVKTDQNQFEVLAFAYGEDGSMYPASGANLGANDVGDGKIGELTFQADGKLDPATVAEVILTLKPSNGAGDVKFTVDMNALTQYAVASDAVMAKQDGYTVGTLSNFKIGADGTVEGVYANGQFKKFGKILTAVFSNPPGLSKEGGSLFSATSNSGEPQINPPGTAANGLLKPGYLEMSGVDLGVEFTNMITTQRGFQANSRTISTTDQMLEELVNLKR